MIWLTRIALCLTVIGARADDGKDPQQIIVTDQARIPWASSEGFNATRWKDILGGNEAGQIPQKDLRFGLLQLAPSAVYPGHRHAAPELYYVLSGKASWTVGTESFEATPGTTVYVPANTEHRMVNLLDEPMTAVWAWWAPGGDRSVFEPSAYEFTEAIPDQTNVGFDDE